MNPSDYPDLLTEEIPPAVMEASLTSALRGARRRRIRRAAGRTCLLSCFLGVTAGMLRVWDSTQNKQIAPLTDQQAIPKNTSDSGFRLVTSNATYVTEVRTDAASKQRSWTPGMPMTAVIVRTEDLPPARMVTDQELLASTSGRPAVLSRLPNGRMELIMVDKKKP